MKPAKINKGFRLAPDLVNRMQAAANETKVNEVDIVTVALIEFLARYDRKKKESTNDR